MPNPSTYLPPYIGKSSYCFLRNHSSLNHSKLVFFASLARWGHMFVPSCKEGWEHGARVTIIALDQPATAFLLGLKTAILNKTGLLLARRERGNDVRLTTMVSATRPRQELGSSSQGLTHIGVKPMPERGPVHCPAFPSQLRCHWSVLFCTDSRPLCLEL